MQLVGYGREWPFRGSSCRSKWGSVAGAGLELRFGMCVQWGVVLGLTLWLNIPPIAIKAESFIYISKPPLLHPGKVRYFRLKGELCSPMYVKVKVKQDNCNLNKSVLHPTHYSICPNCLVFREKKEALVPKERMAQMACQVPR